jgi:hypothetical protein
LISPNVPPAPSSSTRPATCWRAARDGAEAAASHAGRTPEIAGVAIFDGSKDEPASRASAR